MNYLYPLNAIHADGNVVLLYTVDDVKKFIAKHGRWEDHHAIYYYDFSYHCYVNERRNVWVVRDDRGRKVKFDDFLSKDNYSWYNARQAEIRKIAEKGLPIPRTGCSKAGRKMNHTAKKNSGAGHRNRNRALFEEHSKDYGLRNTLGGVIPWEHY